MAALDNVNRWYLARVRLLALRAQVAAGGEPTAEAIGRALEPVLCDVVPPGRPGRSAGPAAVLALAPGGVQVGPPGRSPRRGSTAEGRVFCGTVAR